MKRAQITSISHGNISRAANTGVKKKMSRDGACHETQRSSTSSNAIVLELGKRVRDPEYEMRYAKIVSKKQMIMYLNPKYNKLCSLTKLSAVKMLRGNVAKS